MHDWDEKKNVRNKTERHLNFNDAEQVFNGPTLTFEDSGDKTRIISMRKGNVREQKKYSQRLEKN